LGRVRFLAAAGDVDPEILSDCCLARLSRASGTSRSQNPAKNAHRSLATGLAAVHEKNLVHRDIKPSNIMVRLKDDGSTAAKIIDLGLAKTVDESASEVRISSPGAFAGTPEFASPEQFAGVGVDIRSDLYSLGVTLWEKKGRTTFPDSGIAV
jgi:serine/threonine protein kinase